MPQHIICARHGRTERLWGQGICGEKRADLRDVPARARNAPVDICGRYGLDECSKCLSGNSQGRQASRLPLPENSQERSHRGSQHRRSA